MLRLPPDYARALRLLPDTRENPFYWRERRRDARKGEPFRSLWNYGFVLAMVFGLAFVGLWLLLYLGVFPDGRAPAWLGGQDGGRATFAILAGIHAVTIYAVARSGVNGLLASEARRGTLAQLLMTRVPAFDMAAQIVVHPFEQAALVAVVGLPLYALLVGFGSVGVQEVVALYLLFLVLAVPVPSWRTPAFAEHSPEEVGQMLREQQRSAGCAAFVLTFLLIPISVVGGAIAWSIHVSWPQLAARIPSDVWPALPALPITFAWVAVRLLTAPYTWFGLPLPPWVWVFPILLLQRVTGLWTVSLYLRVAHPAQIARLPDIAALRAWRAGISSLMLVAAVGYLWQPLLETGLPAMALWPGPRFTPAQELAGALFLLGVAGFPFALDRAWRHAAQPPERRLRTTAAAARWVCAPLLPLGLGTVMGAVGTPGAFFSLPVLTTLGGLVPCMAAFLLLAVCMGPASGALWQALVLLPLGLGLASVPAVSALTALSPLGALAALSPTARAYVAQNVPWYHLPPLWAAVAMPLLAAALFRYLAATRRLRAPRPTARAVRVRVRPSEAADSGGSPGVSTPPVCAAAGATMPVGMEVTQPVAASAAAVPTLAAEASDAGQPAPAPEAPPVISPPIPAPQLAPPSAPYVLPGPPAPVGRTGPDAMYGPASRAGAPAPPQAPPPVPLYAAPRLPAVEWRWKPLSPAGAAVMRWLARRTDNPVALYGARRVLPGTLSSDYLTVGAAALAFGLLIALWMPPFFLVLVLPYFAAPLLFPAMPAGYEDPVNGLAMLITAIVLITLLSPMRVCVNVANGFRMERERATLGFLLATPLSSLNVAVGHCVGAVLPALAMWAGAALLALMPTALLAGMGRPWAALWGWGVGFLTSLLYLALCAATGAWIGITEAKPRDITIGVYLLPFSMVALGFSAAAYLYFTRHWSYYASAGVFLGVLAALVAYMWFSAVGELRRMRRGDLPFEGRIVSG